MRLHDAVEWVAWRGALIPEYGSRTFDDGTWISFGDRDEEDQFRENEAAEELRAALATGKLTAWTRAGYDAPVELPAGRWARALGQQISDRGWAGSSAPIVVERAKVLARWPGAAASRGRPPEHDWDRIKHLALAALKKQPCLSRNKLADSLVAECGEGAPDISTIRKKLTNWGLGGAK